MQNSNLWTKKRVKGQNVWFVSFKEHLGDEQPIGVLLVANKDVSESDIEWQAELAARKFNPNVNTVSRCNQCGDSHWRVSALSPNLKHNFADNHDWKLTLHSFVGDTVEIDGASVGFITGLEG